MAEIFHCGNKLGLLIRRKLDGLCRLRRHDRDAITLSQGTLWYVDFASDDGSRDYFHVTIIPAASIKMTILSM